MFIENRETEYLKGKFSILLESCSLETDKEEVLRYLAEKFEDFVEDSINIESEECNEHQLLAHFWGHLGRLFSQKGALNNFTKAEDCCKKALKFKEIDPSSRRIFGYMEITDPVFLKGTKVFFKPNECGVSARQIEHLFEFKVGFSLERLVAFDKSVVDISGNAAKNVSEYKDKQLIGKKTIAIGDIVHISFFTYQKEKNRLKGIISENGKYAFLYKSEVSYEKYITDSDMEIYVGVDSNAPIEVKTIAYNDKYDYYMVSLKQLVLGESSMVEHGDLYNALKNIKIE